jgi:hypothetical protein
MSAPLLSQPKRLHQMNRLEDMGRFPSGGVPFEMLFIYWLFDRVGGRFPFFFSRR